MSNRERVFTSDRTFRQSGQCLNQVLFKGAVGVWPRFRSLTQGFLTGLVYKVSQRVYRFGGQPIMADALDKQCGDWFERNAGPKYCKPWMHAITGACAGVGEVLLVPIDVVKIKRQTNPEALGGRSLLRLVQTEGFNLYQGALCTAARNGPGSFALFGGVALAKDHIFGLEDYNHATVAQNFGASIIGSLCCVVVANPFDVVKTRVQNRRFDDPIKGRQVIKDLLKTEGLRGFCKGFTPKLIVVAPKITFAFTAAQTFIQFFDSLQKSERN